VTIVERIEAALICRPIPPELLREAAEEIERLTSCLHAQESIPALYAEIKRLRAAATRTDDVIAQWANDEAISFDATERLWRALENKP
jgi:hypothetical protein